MIHKKKRISEIYKENNIKRFSFIDFIKSLFFKKDKGSHHYLILFRKHLLSEEHLLKSHINFVLLEKQYDIKEDENTSIFDCFNKL